MRNVDTAVRGLKRAGRWLQGAARAFEDGRWDDVVYSAQMSTEHSVKSVLIALGIDFPREHDVSDVFLQLSRRRDLPKWFKEKVDELSQTIAELAEQRGLAGYGFEEGINADYFKDYAPEALRKAKQVHELCVRLIEETFKTSIH